MDENEELLAPKTEAKQEQINAEQKEINGQKLNSNSPPPYLKLLIIN